MTVFTLVCSKRRKGNSALAAKLVEKCAREKGTASNAAFLGDYRIADCEECIRCVFNGVKCHLDDDFYDPAESISNHHSFVIIAPAYVLSIPGSLKRFLDRFLLFLPYFNRIMGEKGQASVSHLFQNRSIFTFLTSNSCSCHWDSVWLIRSFLLERGLARSYEMSMLRKRLKN